MQIIFLTNYFLKIYFHNINSIFVNSNSIAPIKHLPQGRSAYEIADSRSCLSVIKGSRRCTFEEQITPEQTTYFRPEPVLTVEFILKDCLFMDTNFLTKYKNHLYPRAILCQNSSAFEGRTTVDCVWMAPDKCTPRNSENLSKRPRSQECQQTTT